MCKAGTPSPPSCAPPSTRSRSHRSGRSFISRASKVSHLTSASQHSLIDVNELVCDVFRQTAEIEERRAQSDHERLEAERQRFEAATQLEERRNQAERERTEVAARSEGGAKTSTG